MDDRDKNNVKPGRTAPKRQQNINHHQRANPWSILQIPSAFYEGKRNASKRNYNLIIKNADF